MKKFIIAISPVYLLLWLILGLAENFVMATIVMLLLPVLLWLLFKWVVFVDDHFDDD